MARVPRIRTALRATHARPATRARRRWRTRRCVASPLPRSRQCLAPFFRRTRNHVCSLLALPVPAPTSIGITGGARPCPRKVSTAQTARAASNPIAVADLRAGQGCADCVGEQYGTDGLTCQACEPGKHPHIDHTSCDDCSPVRPRQASAPDSPGNAPQIVAGCAGQGGGYRHV